MQSTANFICAVVFCLCTLHNLIKLSPSRNGGIAAIAIQKYPCHKNCKIITEFAGKETMASIYIQYIYDNTRLYKLN